LGWGKKKGEGKKEEVSKGPSKYIHRQKVTQGVKEGEVKWSGEKGGTLGRKGIGSESAQKYLPGGCRRHRKEGRGKKGGKDPELANRGGGFISRLKGREKRKQ